MLQFASTIELPMRFGHPPDSRRMICPSFLKCSGFHPAWVANSGSQLMSPCLKTIAGFTEAFATVLVPYANSDSWSISLLLGGICSFRSSNFISGANAITPAFVGVFASTAEKKISEYMHNKAVAVLVIKMLSFRLGIGFGSLVPVYVK